MCKYINFEFAIFSTLTNISFETDAYKVIVHFEIGYGLYGNSLEFMQIKIR